MDPSSTETNQWKDKYYNALDQIELFETSIQKDLKIYCRALTRLSLATKGYNPKLDPHLLHLRDQLKQETEITNIKKVITQFSETLLNFEDGEHTEEITTFDEESNTRLIGKQLIVLLQGLNLQKESLVKANEIINTLENMQPDAVYTDTLITALHFLQGINAQEQLEKKEMEHFLSSITQQLANIGKSTQGVSDAVQKVIVKRNNLDQTVSKQMQDLQENSANTTQLEPLKILIKNELENITKQIKRHQQEEEKQHTETENQFKKMAAEIDVVKAEARALKQNLKQASTQAITDTLTKLPNRLAYDQRFKVELARWHRNKTPFSLLVWDIDFFKKINDSFGHAAGDKTLIIISKLLSRYCREMDFVSRYGGEEFTMILPETDKNAALLLANKIRMIIKRSGFNSSGRAINITLSCGIAEIQKEDSQETLFKRADKALYQAKNNGRNQCVLI